ncbi:hypothetical protein LINGRAHAP2_LOCUS4590, partial [Linum grandiflorum]
PATILHRIEVSRPTHGLQSIRLASYRGQEAIRGFKVRFCTSFD